jgi:acetyl-CoA carboxylase carboxyl transferase subunit alpha
LETLPHEKQIDEYVQTIAHLKRQSQDHPLFHAEIDKLEQKLYLMKEKVYGELTPWQRVLICRHSARPHAVDYITNICDTFHELHGDRYFGDDHAVVGGLARIGSLKCVIIGQEKGHDTNSRVKRNFGMLSPEGFRKALRLMRMAEKFQLPVISFLDTPGAYPGLEAEERGQGRAIAENLLEMSRLATPIVVVVIGEGCSGGALGMGVGDVVAMLEHSYYSVISPEGCASILWKDPAKRVEAASVLKLNAENLMALGVIDAIIEEPLGGAHQNPQHVYLGVKNFITEQCQILQRIPKPLLLEQRYLKYRRMGKMRLKDPVE